MFLLLSGFLWLIIWNISFLLPTSSKVKHIDPVWKLLLPFLLVFRNLEIVILIFTLIILWFLFSWLLSFASSFVLLRWTFWFISFSIDQISHFDRWLSRVKTWIWVIITFLLLILPFWFWSFLFSFCSWLRSSFIIISHSTIIILPNFQKLFFFRFWLQSRKLFLLQLILLCLFLCIFESFFLLLSTLQFLILLLLCHQHFLIIKRLAITVI